jgi:hypothetical protein
MFAKIEDGKVIKFPYTFGDLRKDNPNVSFPKTISKAAMDHFGMVAVSVGERPVVGPCQKPKLDEVPTFVDGEWVAGYTAVDMFSTKAEEVAYIAKLDEQAAIENRSKRNTLLAETDYMALSDVVMSDEMVAYRSALRGVSAHANWPNLKDADWPVKP